MERNVNVFEATVIMDQTGAIYASGCPKYVSCKAEKVGDERIATGYYSDTNCSSIQAGDKLPLGGSAAPNVLTTKLLDPVLGYIWVTKASYDANVGQCNECCVADPVLATPALTATPGNTLVNLTWVASPNATSYVVERSTNINFTSPATIYTGSALLYSDTGRTNGTQYFYRITAKAPLYQDSAYGYATATPAP